MAEEHSNEPGTSIWDTAFSDSDRQSQLSDDSLAWNRVAGLLLAVVAIGLVLAILAVMLT